MKMPKTLAHSLNNTQQTENINAIGIRGNSLWILARDVSENKEQHITINGYEKPLGIQWYDEKEVFLDDLLTGYNLLKNADFGGTDSIDLTSWKIEAEEPAIVGVDLSEEWCLKSEHTAFLFATEDAPRPSLSNIHNIPVIGKGKIEYKFSGYFATHRSSGVVVIDFFDDKNNKISEQLIQISHSPIHAGGIDLMGYEYIESIFVPVDGCHYMRLRVELEDQIDLSQPNAYLFFARIFLGLNDKDLSEGQFQILNSPGVCQLSENILENCWSDFATVDIPVFHEEHVLSLDYCSDLYHISLEDELPVIQKLEQQGLLESTNRLQKLLEDQQLDHLISNDSLDFSELELLNKDYNFSSLFDLVSSAVLQTPPKAIKFYSDEQENGQFYVQLGLLRENQGQQTIAEIYYKIALHFYPHPVAHEHLGNFSLGKSFYTLARKHYQQAIALNSQSYWAYVNLSHALINEGMLDAAIENIQNAVLKFPESKLIQDKVSELLSIYWKNKTEHFNCLATVGSRSALVTETDQIVQKIASANRKNFLRVSDNSVSKKPQYNKVLLVADTFLPQCLRYRVEQKIEQFNVAGFDSKYISWTESNHAFQEIPWYDSVIFYRVPALPEVIQLIEYARSLGKPTLYEIDDLLFEPIYPPSIESYGGNVNLDQYYDLLKGMALYRSAAQLCDYALASTEPLLEKLKPLVRTKQGFLHRNALDSNNFFRENKNKNKTESDGLVSIFYGSGTLAHNSDFIDEILPVLDQILREFKFVRLIIAGYLQLPETFCRKYKNRIIFLPFTKSLPIYNNYLQGADINLAVLKQDDINDCKSELKWFEAACFAVPSVVSQTRNYKEAIHQGKDGLIVNSKETWYEALKDLITQPEYRQQIGDNAYKRVINDYSLSKMAENLQLIFSTLHNQYLVDKQG